MNVSNINVSSLDSLNFKDSLKKNKEDILPANMLAEGNVIASSAKSVVTSANSVSSESLMSRNFVTATSESPSVDAKMSILQSKKKMALQSHQILADATKKMLADNGIDRTEFGSPAAVAKAVRRMSNKKVMKSSEDNLNETKKNIEKSAEEALAPKNEQGEPIDMSMGNTNYTSEVPVLTESGEELAEAPVISTGSGESAEVLESAEKAVIQDASPAQEIPSINIVV